MKFEKQSIYNFNDVFINFFWFKFFQIYLKNHCQDCQVCHCQWIATHFLLVTFCFEAMLSETIFKFYVVSRINHPPQT
jgi:hypothetical protein